MLLAFGAVPAQAQCPAIGYSADCSVVIEIRPSGALVFHVNPSIPPYDNIEDTLVGVVNHSGATVFGIALTGNDIFGFDGDGAGDPTGSFWAAGSPFGAYPEARSALQVTRVRARRSRSKTAGMEPSTSPTASTTMTSSGSASKALRARFGSRSA